MDLLERFIFFPDPTLVGTPADLGLAYEDVQFAAADGTALHGWFVPGPRPETLLWAHGNAGNISGRLDNLRLLHDLVGVSVFLFDYRGYGRSSGTPSETGLYADAGGALAALVDRPDVDTGRLVYFGRSLGSAVALELAVREPPHGLILESPFLNTRAMAATLVGPLNAVFPSRFDNEARIAELDAPLLVIHGDRDDVVPFEQGQRLFELAPEPKHFHRIAGAHHNDTYLVGGGAYFAAITRFLDGLAGRDS